MTTPPTVISTKTATTASTIDKVDWPGLVKQVRLIVSRRVDAAWVDDVTGGVLLRLVENTHALGTADNPAAYVQKLTRNAIADFYRRADVENRALAATAEEAKLRDPGAVPGETELDRSSEEAISRCLHPFIEELPATYRDALTLTEIDRLSPKQAAGKLGLSYSGMKSRLQRGRTLLKSAVIRCCRIETDPRGGIIDHQPRKTSNESKC